MPRGLTDIHCHILPYVDDGSDDEDETRDLIAMQSRQGVDRIIITPHLREGMFETSQRQVDMEFDRLREYTRTSCTNFAEAGLLHWPSPITF